MAAYNSNTEADFIFASLVEFLNLWRSGKQGTFNIECREKTASLSFNCSLGHPDSSHLVGKKKKRKCKSKARAARDNARAAEHQAKQSAAISQATATPQDESSCSQSPAAAATTPKRTATSPLESSPKRPVSSLPVWDPNTSSPGALRENLQDVSLSDIPQDVSHRTYHQDVSLGEDILNHSREAREDDHYDGARGREAEDGGNEDENGDENEGEYDDDEDEIEDVWRIWPSLTHRTLSLRRSRSEPWTREWWNSTTPSDIPWWPLEKGDGREYSKDDMFHNYWHYTRS